MRSYWPLFALLAALVPSQVLAQGAAARAAHRDAIVLDTHFDTPALFGRPGWSMLDRHSYERDGSQVDLPRMIEGGVDGGVFTIFTPQGPRTDAGHAAARDAALYRASEIREMVARHEDRFVLALTPDQAEGAVKAKKRFVIMSMENSYPLGRDLSLMSAFHRLGLRMVGPVHTTNNELSDSATDKPQWNGLSPLGRQFVAEANRLGMVIDASHASEEATHQMIALSRAPIILSHSGARAVFNHPRNVDDDLLKALAAKGGVVQINAFSGYMVAPGPDQPERREAMRLLDAKYPQPRTQAAAEAYWTERRAIERKWPVPRARIDDVMDHILHAIRVAGIDHVGLSGDFDGGGGVDGLEDVTDFPKITERLVAAGFSKADIAKFWGGNALRVMREAQKVAEAP